MGCSYFGSWVGHSFSSKDALLKSTVSILQLKRKLYEGTVNVEFRYYKKKNGDYIIFMIDPDKEDNKDYYYTWMTNAEFFSSFCNGMLKFGEISDSDFKILNDFLLSIGFGCN